MAKKLNMNTKVPVPSGKAVGLKSQPITGKLSGMSSLPGSKGLGQSVKTVKSNPIQGKPTTATAMGNGGVINGFV